MGDAFVTFKQKHTKYIILPNIIPISI